MQNKYITKDENQKLFEVFSKLNSPDEINEFLNDLLSPVELDDLSSRWKVANMLKIGRAHV